MAGTIRIATYGTWSYILSSCVNTKEQKCDGFYSLSNFLKIELTVISKDESSERNQEFGEGGMDINEILCLDIFCGEFAKVYLIEPASVIN